MSKAKRKRFGANGATTTVSFRMRPEVLAKLKEIARQEKRTLMATVEIALDEWMSKHTGEHDAR